MKTIDALFGGTTRVKIIRLFLFNPHVLLSLSTIQERAQAPKRIIRQELSLLQKMGFVRRRYVFEHSSGKKNGRKKRAPRWFLNQTFPHRGALQTFFTEETWLSEKHLVSRIARAGKIKLVVISGVFLKNLDSRLDILIVGDDIRLGTLTRTLKGIEANMGRELRFSHLTTADFRYRMEVHDKLLRDVLDYSHKILLDKIGLLGVYRPNLLSTAPGAPF